MRRIFLVIGALLGVIAAAGLIYLNIANQPIVSEIVVAVDDIPAGTVVRAPQFRVARWGDVDSRALQRFVTVQEFAAYDGKVLTSDVRAGFPLGKSQVDSESPAAAGDSLSLAITQTESYYFVLPATPDDIGNWIQPGDRIDMLVTIGQLNTPELRAELALPAGAEQPAIRADQPLSVSLMLPASKLVLQNLRVLRVDREAPRADASVDPSGRPAGLSATFASVTDDNDAPPLDVKRVYVEVTRDQLEVLTFIKRNGQHDFAVRSPVNARIAATEGVAFEDYARWFFAQRGNSDEKGAAPFESAGPYAPAK